MKLRASRVGHYIDYLSTPIRFSQNMRNPTWNDKEPQEKIMVSQIHFRSTFQEITQFIVRSERILFHLGKC